jgi:hypothetical protein
MEFRGAGRERRHARHCHDQDCQRFAKHHLSNIFSRCINAVIAAGVARSSEVP